MSAILANALIKVTRHDNLAAEESFQVFKEILEGETSDLQVAAFLGALRGKGESAGEILGCVRLLREKGITIGTLKPFVVDTCGTGGDNAQTLNISTAAAFVAAGAGVTVGKHGNRSVSSRCGSADLLEALGLPIDVAPEKAQKSLDELGLAFFFAPLYHPILKKVAALRRSLGFKTIFNIAGPLANPVRSRRSGQVVGVFEKRLVPIVAEVLRSLGVESAWVVHSRDGLDEISIAAETDAAILADGKIAETVIRPEEAGLAKGSLDAIKGAGAEENARAILDILSGKKGTARDAVVLNAAAAIAVAGKAANLKAGVEAAQKSLDSGAAQIKFYELKAFLSDASEPVRVVS